MRMRLPNRASFWQQLLPAQVNVGAPERWASLAGGGVLLFTGLWRRGLLGGLLSLLGSYLLFRGASGRCLLYQQLRITSHKANHAGLWGRSPVHVHSRIQLQQPRQLVYRHWRNLENLPRAMRHVRQIQVDGNRSRWEAGLLPGLRLRWESQIIHDAPNERLVWRSVAGSAVDSRGELRFRPTTTNGTEVEADLYYLLPGGVLGLWAAKLFGGISQRAVERDLQRFSEYIDELAGPPANAGQELGRAPVSPGQSWR